MAASRPGNTDRGWNDPPMFDYQGAVSAGHMGLGSPQHTKLNKRVAYPMSSPASSTVPTGTSPLLNPSDGPPRLPPIQILPPVSTTSTPTPLPLLVPTLSPTADSTQQPAIFSPPASATSESTGSAPSRVKVKTLPDLLADLELESEESLLQFVKDGLALALESVKDAVQLPQLGKQHGEARTNTTSSEAPVSPPVPDPETSVTEKAQPMNISHLKVNQYVEVAFPSKSGRKMEHFIGKIGQGRAMEDVKKKLGLMEECWSAGKISPPVKSQLGSLVAALQKNEMEEAHELHLTLMINHTTEVHQWLVAIKRIIQEIRSKTSQLAHGGDEADKEEEENVITDRCLDVPPQSVPMASLLQTTDLASQDTSEPAPGGDQCSEETVTSDS